jgi:hypothetical protein
MNLDNISLDEWIKAMDSVFTELDLILEVLGNDEDGTSKGMVKKLVSQEIHKLIPGIRRRVFRKYRASFEHISDYSDSE